MKCSTAKQKGIKEKGAGSNKQTANVKIRRKMKIKE